ncbi:MAG: hypothetical protein U0R19_41470 [Bryobacteraceae bacterium]
MYFRDGSGPPSRSELLAAIDDPQEAGFEKDFFPAPAYRAVFDEIRMATSSDHALHEYFLICKLASEFGVELVEQVLKEVLEVRLFVCAARVRDLTLQGYGRP